MPQIVVKCPFCHAQSVAMPVFGCNLPSINEVIRSGRNCYFDVSAICGNCSNPVNVRLYSNDPQIKSWNDFQSRTQQYSESPLGTPEHFGLKGDVVRTPPAILSVPDHLPKVIEKAFRTAERNLVMPDSEDGAAMMYRRAIELAVRTIEPGGKEDLIVRINKLADNGILPGTMKDWAHQVRIIGNDSAHEMEGVTRNDAIAAQGFTDALLRYLFTLPKEVQMRRAATEGSPAPSKEESGA